MVNIPEIEHFLECCWNKKKIINGKSFDELFDIEGVPLWWFLHKFFYSHVVPKTINPFGLIKKGKKIQAINRLMLYLSAKLLRIYLWAAENKKIDYMKITKTKVYKKNHRSRHKKILLLTYTNHLSNNKIYRLENLIKEIKKNKEFESFILFADPLSKRGYKRIKNLNNLYQYYDEDISKKAKALSNDLHKKWKGLDNKTKYDLFKKDSFHLWPFLKYSFDFFFSKEFLYFLILYYEIFKKIITKENVKAVVITGTSTVFEKNVIAAANQKYISVVRIQHGINLKNLRPQDSLGLMKHALFSNLAKKNFLERGFKEKEIAVVGPLVYGDIKKYVGAKKSYLNHKNILIVTGPFVEGSVFNKKDYFKIISRIIKEIKKLKDVKIAFKLHPRETHYLDYKKIITKNNYNNVKVFSPNLTKNQFHELIKWSDVFVNFGSNASLEAMIIDRPIVTIDLSNKNFNHNYWIKGNNAIIEIPLKGMIRKAVERALKDENELKLKRRAAVENYCGKIDGKAGERIVKLIGILVNKAEVSKRETDPHSQNLPDIQKYSI